jgi:transposase
MDAAHPTTAPPAAVPSDASSLPDDPAVLKAMLVELLALLRDSRRESAQLRARLDQLLRRLYGPRAERFDPSQPLLFADPETAAAPAAPPPPPPPPTPESPAAARRGHGRQQLPRHLPRQQRVYELSAVERACPCCGQERPVIGREISEQLDFVPACLQVIEHVRLTYGCPRCAGAPGRVPPAQVPAVATAAPAEPALTAPAEPAPAATAAVSPFTTAAKPAGPIARGLPGAGLLAHVIVSKYGDHLPLYRLEHIFSRWGVPLARQTLCDWLPTCAELLRPLYQLMEDYVLQSWVLGTDDTPVTVQNAGRDGTHAGRVWVYWGDAYHPYVVYDYTPNREQTGPQRFLARYLGYLQADAYVGYDALYALGRMVEVACWAHARRKFYEAQATDPERAVYVLGVIRQLYQIEKQADEQIGRCRLGREAGWWLRLQMRQEQSRPLLTSLCQWLQRQRDQVLPKSPIGEAIGYALNQWQALERYTTQGYLAIDNNAAERGLRALAVGRKNYLFFGSDGGGTTAAVLYTFVQTCQRLAIEPWRYLRDVLERLPSWPAERLEELLPDQWAQAQRRAATEAVSGAGPPCASAPAP